MSGANKEALIFRHLRDEKPNPRQVDFFLADAKHIAYGGARGGGKSWAMRRKLVMLCIKYPGLKTLMLRRTMPELRKNHILPLRSELHGYATYKQEERAFVFPNSSRLDLGFCDNEGDLLQYQGQEYDVIGFEEATQFPKEWVVFISTSLRTTRTDFRPRVYYTMNPGGIGHEYMKRLFVDRRFEDNEKPDNYAFIPARVYDNPVIMSANPEYVEMLEALPEKMRRAHLDGDWNVFEGQFFEDFTDDPTHYNDRQHTHVINPFEVPPEWRIYRAFDFGYAKPFSCQWWAIDYDGRFYHILELYGCIPKEADTGVRWPPDQIFAEIARIEKEHRWLKGKQIFGVADPSIWDASRGESIADTSQKHGIYWEKGDNERLPGWMQCHYRFTFDEDGIPMCYVFSTCKGFIRTLPLLQHDDHRPEDLDTKGEDHIADAFRYFCMMHPMKPVKPVEQERKPYSPLDTDEKYDRYDFYRRY